MAEESRQSGLYQLLMIALCVVSLIVVFIQSAFELDRDTATILNLADWLVCFVFFFDFARTFAAAERKVHYMLKWGWIDLLSSVPAVDWLRWGRAVRLIRLFRIFRSVRATRILLAELRRRRAKATLLTAVLSAILLTFFGAIVVLQFEQPTASPNIGSAWEALWWAVVTVTTVGYGDYYPSSAGGRGVAVLLMVVGVGLFSAVSGYIASWFLSDDTEEDAAALSTELAEVREELRAIRRLLESGASTPSASERDVG